MTNSIHRNTIRLFFGIAILCCSMNVFCQTKTTTEITENDRLSDTIVKKTEVWPKTIQVPEGFFMKELVYSRPDGYDLTLSYISKSENVKPRPAILFIHGGGWKEGNKAQFYRQGLYLAETYNIFPVFISYRLSDVAIFPAALIDCKTAVRWIRSVADQYKIDTSRIAVCGGSAGAHLASLTALTSGVEKYESGPYSEYSSSVSLAILFNGHYDMADQLKKHIQDNSMYLFFGGHPWEVPSVYGEASPILWVNKKTPPMLFLHGDKDHYPHEQSIEMAERLKYYGIDAEVEIYKDKEHAWFNKEPDCMITAKRMAEFIVKHFNIH